MTDLKRAYTTLHLRPDASVKEIIEARDDLLFLWDPRRLSERPALRSKAVTQQQEIREAAALLLEQLTSEGQEVSAAMISGPGSDPARAASPSLYDEVFSRRGEKSFPWLTLTVISGLAISLLVTLFLLLAPGEETSRPEGQPTEEIPETPPADNPGNPASIPEGTPTPPGQSPSSEEEVRPPEPPSEPDRGASSAETPSGESAGPAPADPRPSRTAAANRPVLIRGVPEPPSPTGPQSGTASQSESSESENAPADEARPAEQEQELFDFLLEKSRAARMLAGGRFSDLLFDGWDIREERSGESYVDLKVNDRGTTIHFIWGVNPSSGTVRPLSQAARDLEARIP